MERLFLDIQKFASSSVQSNAFEGRYLKLTVEETGTSIPNNTSTVKWTLESLGGIDNYYTISNCSVVITYAKNSGDARVTETVRNDGTVTWDEMRFPASKGSVSGTITVKHKNDGTALPVDFTLHGQVYYGGDDNRSGSLSLSTIPRYPTSVQSLRSKTETSITMNWSSDSTIDYVWYSTNNGTNWTAVGGVNSTSGSYTISNLSANTTYNIKTRVRRKDSQLTTDSSASAIATYNWPNCTSAPNFTIGNSVTLQFYNPLNRTFDIRLWSHTSQSFVSDSITISGTSYTLTPVANTLYASIPNAKESNYNIDCVYSGHTLSQLAGKYSVDENECRPTFSNFTYADVNATTTALTGDSSIIVQNYSNVRATISTANKAVAKNSATMVKYGLIIPGNTTNSQNYSDNSDVVITTNGAKSGTIKVSAEDSRGIAKVVEKTATFKAYTNIQKNEISVVRAGNVGTGVTLTYNGTLWGESFGNVTNTAKSARYRYKKTSDADYSGWNGTTTITPTTNGNNYSFSGGIAGDLGNTGFSAEYSFNIEVEVFDELSSTVFSFTLGTGIPHIAVADDGIAIKQSYDTTDDSVLQVNGKINAKNNINTSGLLLEKNAQITPIDITDYSGTLLAKVKALGTNGTYKAIWFSRTDGGTANISDKPTGSTNAGFVCIATCNRWVSNSDYRYYVECYVQTDRTGYYGIVENGTSSINWLRQFAYKLEAMRGRATTANISHSYENSKAHLELLLATASMTSNKPAADGYILHCSWDNSGQYNGQLFMPNTNGNVPVQFRGCNNGTWGSWESIWRAKTLYSNDNGSNGTVALSESVANFAFIDLTFRSNDGTNYIKTERIHMYNKTNGVYDLFYQNNTGSGVWAKQKCIKINGTSITNASYAEWAVYGSINPSYSANNIYITRVVGYR